MEFIIFGAQGIALGAYQAFHSLHPNRKIRCFLVSRIEENASVLEGIPVLELDKFASSLSRKEKEEIEVLIATPENVMEEIESALEYYGLHCHVRLTSLRWAQFMAYHYVRDREFMPLSALPVGYHRPDIHMFMAKFYKDQPLAENYNMPEWIMPVQAGASLCEERVADLLDCEGENISWKNGNYSELTVLYWMWKNRLMVKASSNDIGNELVSIQDRKMASSIWPGRTRTEYYGLTHYRRILELSEDDVLRLEDNDVDVVLPYPMPYTPDIGEHHKRYLADRDWKALLAALEELQPEYANVFPSLLRQQYFYNYNIILARRDVLANYCSWLFPILRRVEQLSEPKGCKRKDRYIGYMGETLETLYFMYNKDKLELAHTGCRFLI